MTVLARSSVLIGWVAALRVVEGLWIWYRRNWRATVVSSMLQPLLMLVAFGVGFGSLIDSSARAAQATGGMPYLMYLAPALLAVSAVQTAAFESSYPILSSFKWRRTYEGIAAGVSAETIVWRLLERFPPPRIDLGDRAS